MLMKSAETYYWIGLTENGHMTAYRKGLDYVERAKAKLASSELSDDEKERLAIKLAAIETDLIQQCDVAWDTLRGVYPLTNLLGESLFSNALSMKTYEFVDDPDVTASTVAATSFVFSVLEEWSKMGQIDVVFSSYPVNRALENEVLYVFNTSAKFFVHSFSDTREVMADMMSSEDPAVEVDLFQRDEDGVIIEGNESMIMNRFMNAFSTDELLHVEIRECQHIDGISFYEVLGRVYEKGGLEPIKTFANYGFARDRSGAFSTVVTSHLLLLLLALALFAYVCRLEPESKMPGNYLLIAAFFLFGRILPPTIMPALIGISPVPETLMVLSFWWPCLFGIVLLMLPGLVMQILVKKLPFLASISILKREKGVFLAALSLGLFAYFVQVTFIYDSHYSIVSLLILLLTLLICTFTMGITKPLKIPLPALLLLLLASSAWGTCLLHSDAVWPFDNESLLDSSFSLGSVGAALFAYLITRQQSKAKSHTKKSIEQPGGSRINRLRELIIHHPYVKDGNRNYESIFNQISTAISKNDERGVFGTGKVAFKIIATEGCGKSSTLKEVFKTMPSIYEATHTKYKSVPIVGEGSCVMEVNSTHGAGPVIHALKEILGDDVVDDSDGTDGLEFLESFINPLAGIEGLLNEGSGEAITEESYRKRYDDIIARLKSIMNKKQQVVLLIDDCQWLDGDSIAQLCEIYGELPNDSPFLLVFSGTKMPEIRGKVEIDPINIPITPISGAFVRKIMTDALCIESASASEILVNVFGSSDTKSLNLHNVFDVIERMEIENCFEDESGDPTTYRYASDSSNITIPYQVSERIKVLLKTNKEWGEVLTGATCLPEKFNTKILAEALGKSSHDELLEILEDIEDCSRWIDDDIKNDDYFNFTSSFIYRALQKELATVPTELSEKIPSKQLSSKARTIRKRLAEIYEKHYKDSEGRNFLEETASNYYYGRGNSVKTCQYCTLTAEMAIASYSFSKAETYMTMAKEYADSTQEEAIELLSLKMALDEAHIQGDDIKAKNAYERILHYEQSGRTAFSPEMTLKVIRNCYDRRPKRGQWVDLPEAQKRLEALPEQEDKAIKAEIWQFKALFEAIAGQLDSAIEWLEKSLTLIESIEESPHVISLKMRVVNSYANMMIRRGEGIDFSRIETLLLENLELRTNYDSRKGAAMDYGGLSRLYELFENWPKAQEAHEKNLEISRNFGDLNGISGSLCGLGRVHAQQKNYTKALAYADEVFEFNKSYPEGNTDYAFHVYLTILTLWGEKEPGNETHLMNVQSTIEKFNDCSEYKEPLEALLKSDV